jgi:hypothetical protein
VPKAATVGIQPEAAQGRGGSLERRVLLEAEVRELVHAVSPYGVLSRGALARACGAPRWRAGQFESALAAAVRAGRLRRLPLGYYADARTRPWRDQDGAGVARGS